MRKELPTRVLHSRDIELLPSPLTSLVPYQRKPIPRFSIGEAILFNDNYYAFFGDPQEQDHWLIWEGPLEGALRKVVNFYDWNECFHPLDMLIWDEVCSFFNLEDFLELELVRINRHTLLKLRRQVSQVGHDEKELLFNDRLDWKAFVLSQKRGLKLNPFTSWVLAKFQLSFQSQVQLIEAFHKFFRRKSVDAAEFLSVHQDYLETLRGSSKELSDFLMEHTSPVLCHQRRERERVLQGLAWPEKVRVDFDRSLETNALKFQINIETMDDLVSLRSFLDDVSVSEHLKLLLEPVEED